MGFRHPKVVEFKRWATTRRNVFVRWRGEDYDELVVFWWTLGRPRFELQLCARRVEPSPPGHTTYRLMRAGVHRSFLGNRQCGDLFGGWLPRVGPTIARARSRLLEIDEWFRTGEATAHVWAHFDKRNYVYGTDPLDDDRWFFELLPTRDDLDSEPPPLSRRRLPRSPARAP
jgi:hypothetical protein